MAQKLPIEKSVVIPVRYSSGFGSTKVVDETLFRFLVELEVAKAQRLHYCVAVLCLAVDPLASIVDDSTMSQLAERFADGIRSTDLIVAYPPSSWTILLVDAQAEALSSIVHRITGNLGPLPWNAGSASYPGTASGAEDLVRRAFNLAARAQEEGGHQLHLAAS